MQKILALVLFIVIDTITALYAQTLEQVKDINPSGNSAPYNLIVCNGNLYFIAFDNVNFNKLWISDGTAAGTKMLGPTGNVNSSVYELTAYKNKVYFSYNDGINGQEIWVSDGTAAGTVLFNDLYPGVAGSYPQYFTVANDKLFFQGNNAEGERRLYVTDGTVAGTNLLYEKPMSIFNGELKFPVYNNEIYFTGTNSINFGYGFWKSNGTVGGTVLVKTDLIAGTGSGCVKVVGNKMFFGASDNPYGSELWITDGTTAGTQLVKNINADGGGVYGNSNPQAMTAFNNKLYFSASDGVHGQEFWVSDGTGAGTTMIKDVLPGATGSLPYQSIEYNNKLYFTTWQLNELWMSDGTGAGTQLVSTVTLPAAKFAAIWQNKMYIYSAAWEIYQSDGTTAGTYPATAINTINFITSYGADDYFLEYKGDLYFSGANADITNGYELVKLTSGVLPLTLISFTGTQQNNTDVLRWQTANEVNTSHFVLEQSADSKKFTTTATIMAAGNTVEKEYSFRQASSPDAASYYRLQMFDKDGIFSYSSTIKIDHNNIATLTAYYNVSTKQIVIKNALGLSCNWQLVSLNGAVISKGTSSDTFITVPVWAAAAGTYFLYCKTSNFNKSIKITVY